MPAVSIHFTATRNEIAYGICSLSNRKINIFIGLDKYMLAYFWNIMWLDGMVMLPLIILGIENNRNQNTGTYSTCQKGGYCKSESSVNKLIVAKSYFTVLDFIQSHFAGLETTIRSSGEDVLPNVYCGKIFLRI